VTAIIELRLPNRENLGARNFDDAAMPADHDRTPRGAHLRERVRALLCSSRLELLAKRYTLAQRRADLSLDRKNCLSIVDYDSFLHGCTAAGFLCGYLDHHDLCGLLFLPQLRRELLDAYKWCRLHPYGMRSFLYIWTGWHVRANDEQIDGRNLRQKRRSPFRY
jgi:hypothetical protein